jgi:hypothetical protein
MQYGLLIYQASADGDDAEHRRLDRYGARRDEMRAIFETQGDWGRLLHKFVRVAEARTEDDSVRLR